MQKVIINPGSGPVSGATLDHAWLNMERMLVDVGVEGARFHRATLRGIRGGCSRATTRRRFATRFHSHARFEVRALPENYVGHSH